jgi:hypothetical protein
MSKSGLMNWDSKQTSSDLIPVIHYHAKKGLVKEELIRIRRICSSDSDFFKQAETMRTHFLKRGFTKEYVNKANKEVKECHETVF